MPFRPSTTTSITIAKCAYRFSEHPSAKGMPYGQTGRRATVYQVIDSNGQAHALKVFSKVHRSSRYESMAASLMAFVRLPGLQVCKRTVLSPTQHSELLQQYPDLEYAVLMPWVGGQTWQEIVLGQQPLSAEQSHNLAIGLLEILNTMETREMAHCDLSGPNLIIENGHAQPSLALVDVEELYASGLERPQTLPAGSAGYGHKNALQGLWQVDADRFAGAVLLAEILGWRDESVRRIAYGEQFFDPAEVHSTGDRLKVLRDALQRACGTMIVEAFVQAWFSKSLDACPSFADWSAALGNGSGTKSTSPSPLKSVTVSTDSSQLDEAGRYLFDSFKIKLEQGNFEEAEKLINALRALAPEFDEPTRLLEDTRKQHAKAQAVQEELAKLQCAYEEKAAALETQRGILAQERTELEAHLQDLAEREAAMQDEELALDELKHRLNILVDDPDENFDRVYTSHQTVRSVSQIKKAELFEAAFLKHKALLGTTPFLIESLFIKNGTEILTLTDTGKANIWDLQGKKQDEWTATEAVPTVASTTSDGRWIAVGDENGSIQVLSTEYDKGLLFQVDGSITTMSFSSREIYLAVGTDSGYSVFSHKGNLVKSNNVSDVYSMSYSLDGRYLVYATTNGILKILTSSGQAVANVHVGEEPEFAFDSLATFIYCANNTGNIKKLSVPKLNTVLSFSLITDSVITAIALSPDDRLLATATDEGQILLWATSDGKLLHTQGAHKYTINSLNFHPNGKYLVSGSDDGNAILWAVEQEA